MNAGFLFYTVFLAGASIYIVFDLIRYRKLLKAYITWIYPKETRFIDLLTYAILIGMTVYNVLNGKYYQILLGITAMLFLPYLRFRNLKNAKKRWDLEDAKKLERS